MNEALGKILLQLTGKDDMREVSMIELQKITEAHPSFALGQLLFAQKLRAEQHLSAATQVERAAAFFSNTFWFDYLLHQRNPAIVTPAADDAVQPLLHRVIEEEIEMKSNTYTEAAANEPVVDTIRAVQEDEQYAAETTEEVVQQAADEEKQKEVIASVLEGQLAEFNKPVSADTPLEIETEPYHTVDYFASQGIKVDLNNPQDKLGTQVRRFTDWLKQMKTIKPVNDDLGTDPEVENMIQGIAKTSNETKEIVTETMAEVLIKQGKTDKAIQLYIKLSFLNPDKSAYFAAKIEQLKGI